MPTINERLKQVTLKIKRAKEHVGDLDRQLGVFFESEPYKVTSKHDPKTRKLIYYVASVEPTPDCLPLVAGDVIQNLISALDHLAYQIVCSDTGDNPPRPHKIYFPIAPRADEYEAVKRRKMQGARQESFDALDLIEPYEGGKGAELWRLSSLNNIEKHRLLLTVGSQAAGIKLGPLMAGDMRHAGSDWPAEIINVIESFAVDLLPSDKGFPLEAGFKLYVGAVNQEPNPKQQFRFDVALNEPGIAEGKPLIETLHQFTTLVEGIVTALTPRLV